MPTIDQIFEYSSGAINLTGFPSSQALLGLSTSLGGEISLQKYRKDRWGRKVVIPSFPTEYIDDRLRFFQNIPVSSVKSSLFTRSFPKKDARYSVVDFLDFCDAVYETLNGLKGELKDFRHLPEAKMVFRRLRGFDKDLESVLKSLDKIDRAHTFALDTEKGDIVPINKMPDRGGNYLVSESDSGDYDWGTIEDIKIKMKKEVLYLAKEGKIDFKRRIMRFVKDEFEFSPKKGNLRTFVEQLGLPVRLYARHQRLLEKCEKGHRGWEDNIQEVAPVITPKFGGHYNIKNLCPMNLLNRYGVSDEFIPINFKTRCSENKFLFVGLHSGGKSFLLENIVLTSIYGQIPLDMFADVLKIPRYDRIFYYRNPDNSRNGKGKAEKEVADITYITKEARKGDLVIFDEFLDSADASIASWLGPDLLDPLRKSKATVFVSTHRTHNYEALEKAGWTIMSPGYTIENNIVVPTRTIERGIPNPEINKKYMKHRVDSILKSEE